MRTAVVLAMCCFSRLAYALPCEPDDALAEAAASLLLEGSIDAAAIQRALREAGSDLPSARAIRTSEAATASAWVRRVADGADAPIVCGEAITADRRVVLATARAGRLTLAPSRLRIQLARGFTDAYVVLRLHDDSLQRVRVEGPEISIEAGVREAQLVATGPAGPRPIAQVQLVASLPAALGDAPLAERLAALRSLEGASDLRSNRLLAAEATRHAARICAEGHARHLSGEGDPEARLARRGIRARVVGEAVARASSSDAAFDAIAQSPSHRLAIVDRRFTDVGIGVHHLRGRACVVVSLAAWPRAVAN